jgi:hypothetical protein
VAWLKISTPKSLGKQTQPRLKQKDIICVHTMVGYLTSTLSMFEQGGFTGTESHFGVGGIWGGDKTRELDGVAYQFQDTDFTADANFEGSWHIISIETADNAPDKPEDILPWTHKQEMKIVELIVELCKMYNIPPVLIPDTKPGRRGLAYHYQGVPPNLVAGGERWSKAGHVCPGPVRVEQFKNRIIPEVQARLQEHDMPLSAEDKSWIKDTIRAVVLSVLEAEKIVPNVNLDGTSQGANRSVISALSTVDMKDDELIIPKLNQILSAVEPKPEAK